MDEVKGVTVLEKTNVAANVADPNHKGRTRRWLLGKVPLAAAAAIGGSALLGKRASAADGGAVLAGNTTTAEHRTSVLYDGTTGFTGVVLLGNDSFYSGANALYPAAAGGFAGAGDSVGAGGVANGVYGYTDNGSGHGVVGYNSNFVAGAGSGVLGQAFSSTGAGVTGTNTLGTAVSGTSASTAASATALLGLISSASPGGFSAAVRGQNNGTGGSGIGVWGSQSGSGWGLYGTAASGVGVVASGGSGLGASLIGLRAPLNLSPAGTPGAPTTGFHAVGDVYADSRGTQWLCSAAGTPGTFAPVQTGGLGKSLFTAVITTQKSLANSDGVTWTDMDAINLVLSITPAYDCQAILSANADLWTANAGFNQDIGISVSGGAYPTAAGQPEAWKESGGFAGTFSPNAAYVETVVALVAGTTYSIKARWKTNKPGTSTIVCGAGPINGNFSPTRLTARLVVS